MRGETIFEETWHVGNEKAFYRGVLVLSVPSWNVFCVLKRVLCIETIVKKTWRTYN